MKGTLCRKLCRLLVDSKQAKEKGYELENNTKIKEAEDELKDFLRRREEIATKLLVARIHVDRWMILEDQSEIVDDSIALADRLMNALYNDFHKSINRASGSITNDTDVKKELTDRLQKIIY